MAVAAFTKRVQTGVRPFDPYRDLESVVELIEVAFGDRLDPAGQVTLARMQRFARRSTLWRLCSLGGKAGIMPGFVWVEEGCVVGNASLRRASVRGGYLVGNVVVHPDWQGRGIATALMEAVVDNVSARGGRWVGLEVRADNEVAYGLYEGLGFREVGRTLHMLRPAGLPWDRDSPALPLLRRGCGRDSEGLVDLMRAVIPEEQRPLLELREDDYRPGWDRTISQWLKGRRESWWVVEEGGVICGAVRTLHERGRYPNTLEILVAPEHVGRFEVALVRKGIAGLRRSPKKDIQTTLPTPTGPLLKALQSAGFEELRVLVQMRLDLSRRVPIRRKRG